MNKISLHIRSCEKSMASTRIYLKDLHRMMGGMGIGLAEKVHLLFMANYIDNFHYGFRDEEQVDEYCWCYRDLFTLKNKEKGRAMVVLSTGAMRVRE